jgi:hypothetical protein
MEETVRNICCSAVSFIVSLKRNNPVLNSRLGGEESCNRQMKVSGSMEIQFAAAKC